jgi:hypothetical protein
MFSKARRSDAAHGCVGKVHVAVLGPPRSFVEAYVHRIFAARQGQRAIAMIVICARRKFMERVVGRDSFKEANETVRFKS